MKDLDVKVNGNINKNGKVTNYSITQVKLEDYVAHNSTQFKTVMKTAGVAGVTDEDAMRSLFITWLIGVKKYSSADVIRLTGKDKKEKVDIGKEFIQYFNDRPVFGNKATNKEEVVKNVRDFSKMIYRARKQIIFYEKLKYPHNIKIKNQVTYDAMRQDVFGFAAELEHGLLCVTNNWLSNNNEKSEVNPHGVDMNVAFLEGYGEKDVMPIEDGISTFLRDQNKIQLVRSMGKITKMLDDKKVPENVKSHLVRVGKRLPGKLGNFEINEQMDSSARMINYDIEIDSVNENGLMAGDVFETLANSAPSDNGTSELEKSNAGIKNAISQYNSSQDKKLMNALNIVAHNNNEHIKDIAVNKGERFKKGLDVSDITPEELDEAALQFDRLYSPVTQVEYKFLSSRSLKVIDNITINGKKAMDLASEACKGMDNVVYSKKVKYAKVIALRAFVNPDLHLFYQKTTGKVDPFYDMYSTNNNVGFLEIKESVAMKPEDFRQGLMYDVTNDNEIKEGVKLKATRQKNAILPPPNYGLEEKPDIKDVKVDIPKIKALHENKINADNIIIDNIIIDNNKNIINNNIINNNNVDDNIIEKDKDLFEINTNTNKNNIDDIQIGVQPDDEAKVDKDVYGAKLFVEGVDAYEATVNYIYQWLNTVKNALAMNQKNGENNFESGNKEGNSAYQEFTKVIKNTLAALKSPERDAQFQADSLIKLMKCADNYLDDEFMYKDGLGGVAYNMAREILSRGDKMYNMLYNARLGVCHVVRETYDSDYAAYGNASLNEMKEKAAGFKNQYGETEMFKQGFKKPDFNEMYEKSRLQLEIKRKLEKVSKTLSRNYEYTLKGQPDKYLEIIKKKPSTSALARWIVTKDYLDKVYRPGVTIEELKALSNVNVKKLKQDVKKLANDSAFKKLSEANPKNVFSKWNNLEDEEFDKEVKHQYKIVLNDCTENEYPNRWADDYEKAANIKEERGCYLEAGSFVLYRMLNNPANKKIRYLMSSFDEDTRDKVVDLFTKKYAEYLGEKTRKGATKEDLIKVINDPNSIAKTMKNVVGSLYLPTRVKSLAKAVKSQTDELKKQAPKALPHK